MVRPQTADSGARQHSGHVDARQRSCQKKDREIFLKILTIDDDGAWQRCSGDIPAVLWREPAAPEVQEEFFGARGFKQGVSDEEKADICAQIWAALRPQQQQALDAERRRPIPEQTHYELTR